MYGKMFRDVRHSAEQDEENESRKQRESALLNFWRELASCVWPQAVAKHVINSSSSSSVIYTCTAKTSFPKNPLSSLSSLD